MESGNFWHCIAAVLLILLIDYSPLLQSFFKLRLIQYLGEMSFSLYPLHTWLLDLVGKLMVHFIFKQMANLLSGMGLRSSGRFCV